MPYLNARVPLADWKNGFGTAAREAGFSGAELALLMGGAAGAAYGAHAEASTR